LFDILYIMKYLYLLSGGILVSLVHLYLVWHHRDNRKYSISEHAILTTKSHLLYFASHVACEILFVLFSYQFFIIENELHYIFYINLTFAGLDFVQALIPSRGRTEKAHIAAAYISWCCFLLGGILALFNLDVIEPYNALASILLIPILGMFFYMHFYRSKLYPYQLLLVPLFVFYMLIVTIGSS